MQPILFALNYEYINILNSRSVCKIYWPKSKLNRISSKLNHMRDFIILLMHKEE